MWILNFKKINNIRWVPLVRKELGSHEAHPHSKKSWRTWKSVFFHWSELWAHRASCHPKLWRDGTESQWRPAPWHRSCWICCWQEALDGSSGELLEAVCGPAGEREGPAPQAGGRSCARGLYYHEPHQVLREKSKEKSPHVPIKGRGRVIISKHAQNFLHS